MKSCKRDTKFKEKLPHDNHIPRGDSGPLITKNIPQIIPFRKYTSWIFHFKYLSALIFKIHMIIKQDGFL